MWDRAGASVCKPWSFRQGQVYTSVSLLRYHGQKLAFAPEWEPANQTRNLPSHNQWNMYFESDDGARRPVPIRPLPIGASHEYVPPPSSADHARSCWHARRHTNTHRPPHIHTPVGACHYFVYSALIHDRLLRWRRHVIRELLLMMNWRVVAAPHAPLNTKIFASWLGVSGE